MHISTIVGRCCFCGGNIVSTSSRGFVVAWIMGEFQITYHADCRGRLPTGKLARMLLDSGILRKM